MTKFSGRMVALIMGAFALTMGAFALIATNAQAATTYDRVEQSNWRFTNNVRIDGTLTSGTISIPAAYLPLPKVYAAHITDDGITDKAGTSTQALADFPTNALILGAALELNQAFAGGSVSAVTIKCGDAGDDDELFSAVSVFTGVSTGWVAATAPSADQRVIGSMQTAYAPQCVVACTAADCDTLTAGDAVVHIYYSPVALHD